MKRILQLGNPIFWLAIVCCMNGSSEGQTFKDILPEREFNLSDLLVEYHNYMRGVIHKKKHLNLSQETYEAAHAINNRISRLETEAAELRSELGNKYEGPKDDDFNRMFWNEFVLLLDDEQLSKLNERLIATIIYKIGDRELGSGSNGVGRVGKMVSGKAFAQLIGITESQQRQIQRVVREAKKKRTEYENDRPETTESDLFAEWQEALYELLLPLQQSRYNEALGKEARFLDRLLAGSSFKGHKLQLFDPPTSEEHPDFVFESWAIKRKPQLGFFLHLTHPHLDAKLHPHALFDFMVDGDVARDLGLSEGQKVKLEQLREDWFAANPKPEELKVPFEYGFNMTTRKMRSAAAELDEQFAKYYEPVDQILTEAQKERMRQLGNQILMNRGWQSVPLTCPEWRDYLDLTRQQQADFLEIQTRFRTIIERRDQESQARSKAIVDESEAQIANILTPEQYQAVLLMCSKLGWN